MTRARPDQEWWTPAQLAEADLPDIPATRQGVDALAARNGWRAQPEKSRKRAGRGGGWEYHWQLLPPRAQRVLLRDTARQSAPDADRPARDEVWTYFDGLPEAVKEIACKRLAVLGRVEGLSVAMGRDIAVSTISAEEGVSARTIWNWLGLVAGVDPADRLAYLAPRNRAATRKSGPADCDPEFLDYLKAAYLRLARPSFTASYDATVKICKAKGWSCLTLRTARRWIEKNVPRVQQVYAREGEAGLARCFPPQIRDRSMLRAGEAVCADCHKIDVFVQWPGIDKPVRPQIAAFQDLYSNKILAWRVDLDPNKVMVMAAFSDLIAEVGIPKDVLFDNGKEFANFWMTGGSETRFRFVERDDTPLGIIPLLGCKVHWATPGHGQAKPIERGFRDFADRIAKDPRFAGAYVGHKPDAKPEDYGSRAIPRDEFFRVLAEGVLDHNARPGRLTANAAGRSFDETFAASYQSTPIKLATPEQQRLCLMGQEVRKLHRNHGGVTVNKNGYWSDWMSQHAGEEVVVRFNPENLWEGTYIYTKAGEYLGFAECREKVGFFDILGARAYAKQQRARRKAEKELLDAMRPVSVAAFSAELDALPAPETPEVEARIVQMSQMRARKVSPKREIPAPAQDAALDAARDNLVIEFRREAEAKQAPASEAVETAEVRFRRALDIEAREQAGQPVGTAEANWYAVYSGTPEYTRQRMMAEDFEDFGGASRA